MNLLNGLKFQFTTQDLQIIWRYFHNKQRNIGFCKINKQNNS